MIVQVLVPDLVVRSSLTSQKEAQVRAWPYKAVLAAASQAHIST